MTQVFNKKPTIAILNKILGTVGLKEFREEFSFRKKDFLYYDTVNKMNILKPELEEFYFPCKAKIYLENIDEQKVITIFRQFLRVLDYNLVSKEKYSNGEKYIQYTFISKHRVYSPKNKIIVFSS
jgi:hypothetical protein